MINVHYIWIADQHSDPIQANCVPSVQVDSSLSSAIQHVEEGNIDVNRAGKVNSCCNT